MNKEAKENQSENTLLTLLMILEDNDITDSTLNRRYGLDHKTLGKIRKGEELPRAHSRYFACLMEQVDKVRNDMSRYPWMAEKQKVLKEQMFELMLKEVKTWK